MFRKNGVLENFAKFSGKHLCQSLFFNKVAGAACDFIKKETLDRCFPMNFAKFLRTPFFKEHLRWLLLNIKYSEVDTSLRLFWVLKNSSKEFTFLSSGAIKRRHIFVFNLFIWFQVSRKEWQTKQCSY